MDGTRVVHAECGTEIELQPHCPHCDRDVGPAELTLSPRQTAAA